MQVGTTLPQVVLHGHRGTGARSQWQGLALQLDLQFQVPVYLLHLGTPKASVLGAVTSCPDAGRFYLPGLPRYLGTQLPRQSRPASLLLLIPGHHRSLNGRRRADRQTDSLNRPLLHTCPPLSQLPLPSSPPPPPESRLSLPLSSALTGEFCFLCFYLCFCNPHSCPRPRPRPRPHTYRPTLTPIQLVRRKPSFTDRTSEITLRYYRRGLVDRFFLDGPTVTFRIASQLQSVSSTAAIPNSCRALDPYPPASTSPSFLAPRRSLNCPRRRRPPSQPPSPLPVMPATAPRPQ